MKLDNYFLRRRFFLRNEYRNDTRTCFLCDAFRIKGRQLRRTIFMMNNRIQRQLLPFDVRLLNNIFRAKWLGRYASGNTHYWLQESSSESE
ncbi:hypothetical protein CEXT_782911 [Caerostris extrusa]|uniref:Uncharacterized protein n=1 Tax=Caerostris extrusa TaxID=172846 RepID=A0AAV4W6G6_CAEEX|nr:hypothetical protein CEXT_782911 [Caerostris extrusa]